MIRPRRVGSGISRKTSLRPDSKMTYPARIKKVQPTSLTACFSFRASISRVRPGCGRKRQIMMAPESDSTRLSKPKPVSATLPARYPATRDARASSRL